MVLIYPALRKLREEDLELEVSLGYILQKTLCKNKTNSFMGSEELPNVSSVADT